MEWFTLHGILKKTKTTIKVAFSSLLGMGSAKLECGGGSLVIGVCFFLYHSLVLEIHGLIVAVGPPFVGGGGGSTFCQ